MATSFQRSEFEQLLSTQLLSLSEVVETLADRVIALEERLADVELGLSAASSSSDLSSETGDLLHASERKVRVLRDRLALDPQGRQPSLFVDHASMEDEEPEASSEDEFLDEIDEPISA